MIYTSATLVMLFSEIICRICSLTTAIKILLFDKNCHIYILTKKEPIFPKTQTILHYRTSHCLQCAPVFHPLLSHHSDKPNSPSPPSLSPLCQVNDTNFLKNPTIRSQTDRIDGYLSTIPWDSNTYFSNKDSTLGRAPFSYLNFKACLIISGK